jgi:hypothetical protein
LTTSRLQRRNQALPLLTRSLRPLL